LASADLINDSLHCPSGRQRGEACRYPGVAGRAALPAPTAEVPRQQLSPARFIP
jgi:hypothetical protein